MTINADITIFNKVRGERRRDVYVPTYIRGVSWYVSHSDSQEGTAFRKNSKYVVRIPINARITGNKQYINPDDFYDLPLEVRDNYWTIQTGCFVCHGIVDIDTSDIDEQTLLDLKEETFTVNAYADNTIRGTNRTKHWRIGGA